MAPSPSLSRRAVLALGGSAALGAVLAACEGSTQQVPMTGDGATATGTAGGPPPKLRQWYHQYNEEGGREAVERYAAEYEAADVTVSWQPGSYDRTTVTALVGGDGPDVFEYANGPSIDMIRDGLVVDLTDAFGDALSDFNPRIIDRMTYDGKIWAIPQVIDTQVLVYRPSLLEQVGIEPPRKMADLQQAARELTTDRVKGLFLGNDGGAGRMGGPMLWSAGLDYLDKDKVAFDSAGAAEALTVLRTFWTDEVLLLDSPEDWDDPTPLTSGRTAMQWTGLWTFPRIRAELGDDFGAIPWPSMPGGSPRATVKLASLTTRRPGTSPAGCGWRRPSTSSTSRPPTGCTSRRGSASSRRPTCWPTGRRSTWPPTSSSTGTRRPRCCGPPGPGQRGPS